MRKAAQMKKILCIMLKEDGFVQITTNNQHYVITDITWRFGQSCAYWGNVEQFVHNYTDWVKRWISPLAVDSPSMWEQWAGMVRELTLGS